MQGTLTVAIIEDDTILAFLFREVCRAAGWEVTGQAQTIEEARALLSAPSPDLVLLDYSLGEGDGIELLAAMRSVWPLAYTTLVTGWDIDALSARIDFVEPDCLLQKPISAAKLASHLEARRSAIEHVAGALHRLAEAA